MTREEAKELLPIIKAFSEGKEIEYRSKGFNEEWKKVTQIPNLSFNCFEFRIKPEPKYRPFKDAEECWNEMQKHRPFGWLKVDNQYRMIIRVAYNVIQLDKADSTVYLKNCLAGATFADGTPFGILEE